MSGLFFQVCCPKYWPLLLMTQRKVAYKKKMKGLKKKMEELSTLCDADTRAFFSSKIKREPSRSDAEFADLDKFVLQDFEDLYQKMEEISGRIAELKGAGRSQVQGTASNALWLHEMEEQVLAMLPDVVPED